MKKMHQLFEDLKRNMGYEQTTSKDIQECVERYYGPNFNKSEAKRLPQYLKEKGILESNEHPKQDNKEKRFWLSEKTKKEASPSPF